MKFKSNKLYKIKTINKLNSYADTLSEFTFALIKIVKKIFRKVEVAEWSKAVD